MDNFKGTWELVPEKTEGAEQFWDKTNLPEETRKQRRQSIPVATFGRDGEYFLSSFTHKGLDKPLMELRIKPGTPAEYSTPDGGKNTILLEVVGERFKEKHKAVKGDLVREYDAECYLEGGNMVRVYSKDGACMKNVYKKI